MENYDNSESPKKWYDNKVIVGILIFFFFPVGLYALWKSNNITKGWKVGWTLIVGLVFISVIGTNDSDLNVETYEASTTKADNETTVDSAWAQGVEKTLEVTDILEAFQEEGVLLDLSLKEREVYLNESKWDSLTYNEKEKLVKSAAYSINEGWLDREVSTHPIFFMNTNGEDLAVYNGETKSMNLR